MLYEKTLFGWRDKVEMAIDRIRQFCPPEGYWLAFSGGKDSVCLKRLAEMSGAKYEAKYNAVPIDPPEIMAFIREQHPDVGWVRPAESFIELFLKHGFPIRQVRWCCEELKEHGGEGRIVLTGVRWAESARRKSKHGIVTSWKEKKLVNPMIDWLDEDVWEFIRREKIPYCTLYDEGWKRLGCVLCPMAEHVEEQIARWPKVANVWHRAFLRFYDSCGTSDKPSHRNKKERWSSGEALWLAWLNRRGSLKGDLWQGEEGEPMQCEMFAGAGSE